MACSTSKKLPAPHCSTSWIPAHIKRPIKQYIVGLNLKGVTTRIEKALEA